MTPTPTPPRPTAPPWPASASSLLTRLDEIHGGRHAWVGQHLAALLPLADPTLSPKPAARSAHAPSPQAPLPPAPSIAVTGNCQAWPLFLSLRQWLPAAHLQAGPTVHLASAEEVQAFQTLLPTVEVLLMHRIQPGYRNDIGLDNQIMIRVLAPRSHRLVLRTRHYRSPHPWIGDPKYNKGLLAPLDNPSPLGHTTTFWPWRWPVTP